MIETAIIIFNCVGLKWSTSYTGKAYLIYHNIYYQLIINEALLQYIIVTTMISDLNITNLLPDQYIYSCCILKVGRQHLLATWIYCMWFESQMAVDLGYLLFRKLWGPWWPEIPLCDLSRFMLIWRQLGPQEYSKVLLRFYRNSRWFVQDMSSLIKVYCTGNERALHTVFPQ